MLTVSEILAAKKLQNAVIGYTGPIPRDSRLSHEYYLQRNSEESRIPESVRQRRRIESNYQNTLIPKDDNKFRTRMFYYSNRSATNPIEPIKSSDSIYRKLGKAIRYIDKNSDWQPYIHILINEKLMPKLENRTMREKEYFGLCGVSMKNLVKQWEDKFSAQHGETQEQ